jgi:small-conductance mechanosensitive channel
MDLNFFDRSYLDNTVWQWTAATGVALGLLFVTLIVRRIIRSRYARLAATPGIEFMELPLRVASRTTSMFLLLVSIFLAAQMLELPKNINRTLLTLATIAAFWQVGLWATAGVVGWLDHRQQKSLATDRAAAGTIGIISFIARAMIWALVLLLTLDNLGVNITTLVAGLGIGGIAVALAVQNVLGDLLASLSITLDRPFVVGDAITVDDFSGTVEQIGVKSVRLRSVNGEQIIMPNSNLLSSRVRNWGRMQERRITFTLGLSTETPRDKLVQLPKALRRIVEAEKDLRFDRSHFTKIGTALEFETVYFVTTPDYARYMDIQQNINLNIIELLEREKIDFAMPPQKLLLENGQAALSARAEGVADDAQVRDRAVAQGKDQGA